MNKRTPVAILMIFAAMAWMTTATFAQADNDTKAPAVAPAPAKTPAANEFEPAGKAAGEQAPAQTPAEGEAPKEDQGKEGQGEEGAPGQEQEQSPLMRYFPFLMIGGFLLLWMFMGRGRKKKEAQRKAMLESLSKGDRVVTIGGVVGTIVETRDTEIVVKVDDNTRVKFARWAVRNAGDAANEDKKKDTQEQQ